MDRDRHRVKVLRFQPKEYRGLRDKALVAVSGFAVIAAQQGGRHRDYVQIDCVLHQDRQTFIDE